MSVHTERTFPARFEVGPEDLNLDDIPDPPAGQYPVCNWRDPDDCQADNDLRAMFAGAALKRYAEVTHSTGEPVETVLTDMFNDLRHLCDAAGVDFDGLAGSDLHYTCELRGEF